MNTYWVEFWDGTPEKVLAYNEYEIYGRYPGRVKSVKLLYSWSQYG